jgi:uncharacterized protein (DUF1800 family)
MVRSDQQLVERMTLIWHSWFATSIQASNARVMIEQNEMMRARALGNFHDLFVEVTRDLAMLLWLNGAQNSKSSPNENYARESMELFTLGADRGYDQLDVHEVARALTGFTCDWTVGFGPTNFRYEPSLHDNGVKTIFGHHGQFDYRDTCRLCVQHPLHPSFMVSKLWGYFVGAPIPAGDQRALEHAYVNTGFATRPLVEAILRHPLFHAGPRMVIPPVVYCAGLLRARGLSITTNDWAWIGQRAGQRLFDPPNVAGWNYEDWLDTARWSGRFAAVTCALQSLALTPPHHSYTARENAEEALSSALRYWGDPPFSASTHRNLLAFSQQVERGITAGWEQVAYRVMRQNALRALIPTTPEWQCC